MLGPVRKILMARKYLVRPFSFQDDKVTKRYKASAVAANIEDTELHDLRRAFGSYMVSKGIPPAFVQQWMGHTDWSITEEYYLGTPAEMWNKVAAMEINLLSKN